MTQDKYRRFLLKTLIELEESVDNLNLAIFNLAMSGEWKDIDELFKEGDTFNPKHEDFGAITDTNIKHLLSVVDKLSETFQSIKNVNAITRKEMNRLIVDSADDLPY